MSGSLPIAQAEDQILLTLEHNQVMIISTPAGTGKSTQVPQYCLKKDYNIVLTQPRRIAARSIAEWISHEQGCELGGLVGYKTAFESKESSETRLPVCTDGLQMVRSIQGLHDFNLLIIDEVHEYGLSVETLIAWVKKEILHGASYKVILMSATLEAEQLSEYFDNAPIVACDARNYPVEQQHAPESDLVKIASEQVDLGNNILIFRPGRREIEKTIKELSESGVNAKILPLYGDQSSEEQELCFKSCDIPKIVISTNIAQTSITISDIDVVLDDGRIKRLRMKDGVEELYTENISQADCLQRKGRAGRTKSGQYFLCSMYAFEERIRFSKPEIELVDLSKLCLMLTSVGVDATELNFR